MRKGELQIYGDTMHCLCRGCTLPQKKQSLKVIKQNGSLHRVHIKMSTQYSTCQIMSGSKQKGGVEFCNNKADVCTSYKIQQYRLKNIRYYTHKMQ